MTDVVDLDKVRMKKETDKVNVLTYQFGTEVDTVILKYINNGVNPTLLGGVLIRRAMAAAILTDDPAKARTFLERIFTKYIF